MPEPFMIHKQYITKTDINQPHRLASDKNRCKYALMHHRTLKNKMRMVYIMTMKERRNWEINIENVAAEVATKAGSAVVRSIFQRYDAKGLHDLSPQFYSEVFADLEQVRND